MTVLRPEVSRSLFVFFMLSYKSIYLVEKDVYIASIFVCHIAGEYHYIPSSLGSIETISFSRFNGLHKTFDDDTSKAR